MADSDNLTEAVIGAAIEVHREMGPGLLESIYQLCLVQECRSRGLDFVSQAHLPLIYKGTQVGNDLIIDLFFPGRLIVELKAVEKLLPVHEAQLLSYLRLSKTHIGLLLNFNVPVLRNGIKRMIL